MSKLQAGQNTLTVDTADKNSDRWSGFLNFPELPSENITFKLYSGNRPYSSDPFCKTGSQKNQLVMGWIESNRPITLLEPFVNSLGGGTMSEGYQYSSRISGTVRDLVEDEHINHEPVISEVGFGSTTLKSIAEWQDCKKSASKSPNVPFETKVLKSSAELDQLGRLEFSITYKKHEFLEEEVVSRAFTRLHCHQKLTIWEARDWLRFQLIFIDFLGGRTAGSFTAGNRASREYDSEMRIDSHPRKGDDHVHEVRFFSGDPINRLTDAIAHVWSHDSVKTMMFAANTLRNGELGVMEKFSRTIGFVEKTLRDRYATLGQQKRKQQYVDGIDDFNAFIKSAPDNISEFAEAFMRVPYPKETGLKDLLNMAFKECRHLGLRCDASHALMISKLRNQVSHGDEKSDPDWITEIMTASEIGLAVIELLTAKDMELDVSTEFRPRMDTFGYQLGIYDKRLD